MVEKEGWKGHAVEVYAQCAVVDSIQFCDKGVGSKIYSKLLVSRGKKRAVNACRRVKFNKQRVRGDADTMIKLELTELKNCAVVLRGVRRDDKSQACNNQRRRRSSIK